MINHPDGEEQLQRVISCQDDSCFCLQGSHKPHKGLRLGHRDRILLDINICKSLQQIFHSAFIPLPPESNPDPCSFLEIS